MLQHFNPSNVEVKVHIYMPSIFSKYIIESIELIQLLKSNISSIFSEALSAHVQMVFPKKIICFIQTDIYTDNDDLMV